MSRYGMFSSKDDIDYSESTKKTFGGRKALLLTLSILAAASDFIALIVFAVAGYGGYIAIPVFLLVADALLITGVCLCNFRFKYAIGVWSAYIVVAVIILSFVSLSESGNYVVMTNAATALNVLSHLALFISIIVAGIYPILKNGKKSKATVIAVAAIAVILVCSFTVFFSINGYFGQGFVGEYRVVTYRYDASGDCYIADSIEAGNSKKVLIPKEFNGKKVRGVECSIFTDKTIKSVELQSREKLYFRNPAALRRFNEDLSIGVDKDLIDSYRESFLSSYDAREFANNMYPVGLEEDERYITFSYGEGEYDSSMDVMPTWIGKAGDKFDLSYASDLPYVMRNNENDDKDLIWCYSNNNAKILRDLTDSSGNKLVGASIDKNVSKVGVQFKKVFKVEVGEDNDSVFEADDGFKKTIVDGVSYNYRFVTSDTIDSMISELSREGFDLTWNYAPAYSLDVVNGLTSLKSALDQENMSNAVTITPVWKLKKPANIAINSSGVYTYGDIVTLEAQASAPNSDCVLEYEWEYRNSRVGVSKQYVMQNVLPSQSGVYRLTIIAKSDKTSLESFDTTQKNIVVNKKALNVTWQQPSDMVYDGQPKVMTYATGEGELINGDVLEGSVNTSGLSAVNAGAYTAQISLTGGIAERYSILVGDSHSYKIEKRPVQVQWSGGDFTYNGLPQNVTAEAKDLSNLNLPLTCSSAKTNAGSYTALAYTTNGNYVLSNPTYAFVINQKTITVNWTEGQFVYSGSVQYPIVAQINGLVGSDSFSEISGKLIYSGYENNIDAGENYSVKVALQSPCNYKFDSEQSKSYNIVKRALSVRASASSKTYDGFAVSLGFEVISGLAAIHTKSSLGTASYVGSGVNAKDAGAYVVNVVLPENSVTKNYEIDYAEANFRIFKADAALVWGAAEVANGVATAPKVIVSGQTYFGEIESISYIFRDRFGSVIESIPYESGSYSVEAVVTSKNYSFSNRKISFTITVDEIVSGEAA